jgi:acetyl/propionyl-CoA carboxylase alpha subunit
MSRPRIGRLLVAARGLEALRIGRVCQGAGIEAVALLQERDGDAAWPDLLDYASYCAPGDGPWPEAQRVVDAAQDAGCDAIHPGWGPLARSALLAGLSSSSNLGYVGPGADRLDAANDRLAVRRVAQALGIPVVPGTDALLDPALAVAWVTATGTPVMLKPARAGVPAQRLLQHSDVGPAVEAMLARGPVFLERLVEGARLIEVPVFGDGEGGALAVGDREVTVRIDGQRLLAECPASGLPDGMAATLHDRAERLCAHLRWIGLGAVQFLLTPDGRAYLLQLRPGLQPWSAVTEVVYGVDLIDAQIRLTAGDRLGWEREDLQPVGFGVCLRLVARSEGMVETLPQVPAGPGASLLHALEEGSLVEPRDDLCILTVVEPTRQAALVRARALATELAPTGVDTDLPALLRLFDAPDFWRGPLDRDRVRALMSPAD